MVLLPKKKVIITLAVLTAILAIVIMVFALLKASNDKKELARLKTSIAMTLLHEAKLVYSEGIDKQWFGEANIFLLTTYKMIVGTNF